MYNSNKDDIEKRVYAFQKLLNEQETNAQNMRYNYNNNSPNNNTQVNFLKDSDYKN